MYILHSWRGECPLENRSYEEMLMPELRKVARERGIKVEFGMTKAKLMESLKAYDQVKQASAPSESEAATENPKEKVKKPQAMAKQAPSEAAPRVGRPRQTPRPQAYEAPASVLFRQSQTAAKT